MKKYIIFSLIILLTSCGSDETVDITFNQEETSNIQETQKTIENKKVPEKNLEEIEKALSIKKDQNTTNGSSLKIENTKKEIDFETENNKIVASNGAIITEKIPENFPKNFSNIFSYKIYSNSLVPNYGFSANENFDFSKITQELTKYFTQEGWKNLSEDGAINSLNFELNFEKQNDNKQERFNIRFSEKVPNAFIENKLFSGKFIEFKYESFEGNLNN